LRRGEVIGADSFITKSYDLRMKALDLDAIRAFVLTADLQGFTRARMH
jgi:hypothetical protein